MIHGSAAFTLLLAPFLMFYTIDLLCESQSILIEAFESMYIYIVPSDILSISSGN
jgi:hypothetical protein